MNEASIMFTGIIEESGAVKNIVNIGRGKKLEIAARRIIDGVSDGDSVCINGVCLTVVRVGGNSFEAEAVPETLSCSTLAELKVGDRVNLERALCADGRLGGHFVQGHVDGVGVIQDVQRRVPGSWFTIRVGEDISRFVVEKGSIAIDGISLTVAEKRGDLISIAVIPFTLSSTNLSEKTIGDRVNIEVDIIGKYVRSFLESVDKKELTLNDLENWGF
jgi:riboflavin synthase